MLFYFVNQMPLLNGLPICYIINTPEAVWKFPTYVGKLPQNLRSSKNKVFKRILFSLAISSNPDRLLTRCTELHQVCG